MKEYLLNLSMTRSKSVFITTLLLTLIAGAFIPLIIIDTDPENMLPEEQIDRVYHNQVKSRFNLHDAIVVGAVNQTTIFNTQSLKALEHLTTEIGHIDGVIIPDLTGLSTVDNITQKEQPDGSHSILFEWMMKKAPDTEAGAKWIDQHIDRLPLLQSTLVSQDNKASIIYVPIQDKNESYRISTEIQDIIATLNSSDHYYITGLPVAEDTFGFQMFVQMGISAPLAALMIFLLMWLFFRNLKFIAAPMIIAMSTVIITMGIMIGMGFTVHIMSSMIPIFLMPIAVVDSIHILSEFSDNYKQSHDRESVIKQVVHTLFRPMLFTSVTSAVGFASLLLTPIPPVQIFGAFVAFGILLAFLLTIVFIPAYLTKLSPNALDSLLKTEHKKSLLEKCLPRLGSISLKYKTLFSLSFSLVILLSVWGIYKIEINDNPIRWFKSEHPIRISDRILNQHFAGTYDAYIVLESDTSKIQNQLNTLINSIKNPSIKTLIKQQGTISDSLLGSQLNQLLIVLEDYTFTDEITDDEKNEIDELLQHIETLKSDLAYFQKPSALQEIETLQTTLNNSHLIGKSNSLVDAVKTVYRELKSGEQKDYQLPSTQKGIAQTLLQYQSSHRPHDLWHIVTQDYSSTTIWLQLKSGDNQDMSRVKHYLDRYLQSHPLSNGTQLKWAGKTYLNMVWQQEMVQGMVYSLLGAFIVVLCMMTLLFRSFLFGLLAMLPLTITITSIYGLIGWIGKDYDMPIAVLSALTLGLSVDFAIHFLQRAREIYQETKDFSVTIHRMFGEPANAISRNAIVIALGFTPLLAAPLVPYITVGFFLASIMIISALVTLILLPIALQKLQKYILK